LAVLFIAHFSDKDVLLPTISKIAYPFEFPLRGCADGQAQYPLILLESDVTRSWKGQATLMQPSSGGKQEYERRA
jgi:hypothetical protein